MLVRISASAQQKFYSSIETDTLHINFDNHYKLSHVSIIPNSETITLRDSILNKNDYNINYSSASFSLSDSLPYSIFDTLVVRYQAINLGLRREYKKRSLVVKYDLKNRDTIRVSRSEPGAFTPESIFGSEIQKSGTIVRGFTVGTTKDFSLNSGLRLQLSGRLSKNIQVVAALTDQNTPIQPEGNTAKLDELDKVFIQIKHPNAQGTFGDYELQKRFGEFGVIDRKLQGLEGEFNYGNNKGYVAIASSKGQFNTNKFNGVDGVQGPYKLTGKNNEPDIIIIAGTEKVYVDGVEMKRGERNDYTIEYGNAEITFTPNRLITSASRISVDFEYTDRRYSRNFFGSGIETKFFKQKLSLQVQYLREGDNQDAPIDISLTDSDKKILAAAGNDRLKAAKSGVVVAAPDSQGVIRGTYQKIDTLINNKSFSYYLYSPGKPQAIYNITFSYIGEQQGDYIRQSIGNFQFVGINKGNYSPVILLPLPELKQQGNVVLNYKPADGVELNLEYAGSSWDRNRFSSIGDNTNLGYARNISLKVEPRDIKIGSIDLGRMGISYKDRYVENRFTSLDRYNTVEFSRDYNLQNNQTQNDELLREISLNLIPIKELNINTSYGHLKQGSSFFSDRFNNNIHLSNNNDYNVDYNLDYVSTKNSFISSKWYRQKGSANYKLGFIKPGVEFLAEDKRDNNTSSDSLLSSSLKYYEIDPVVDIAQFHGLDLSAKYSLRDDYLPLKGELSKESRSTTQYYQLQYSGIRQVNSTLNFTLRHKKYSDEYKKKGFLDNETILIRSQTRLNLWNPVTGNLYYEVSTQKSAKLQKVFVQVAQGSGNYKYLGDLNHNGIKDENEFEPTVYDGNYILVTVPTDKLYPVIDLKTSTRWKIKFSEMFNNDSFWSSILQPVSTETYARVEENSREEDYKKIYLLQFSSFQNPEKTIQGFNYIQQDVYFFENNPEFSMRFRYSQRKSMNQYNAGIERDYNRERSLRIKFKLVPEISNQTDLINTSANVAASAASNRVSEITGNKISSDFSYRPQRNIEVGFQLKVGRSTDYYPANPTILDVNSQSLRFTLSLASKGRLRMDFERSELTVNTTKNFIPFELTQGNVIGKNYFWSLNFDYRLSNNLQSTVSYSGRLQGRERVVNTVKAEVRAYF